MNVAAADLVNVARIRIYCEAEVDGVQRNSSPLQFDAIEGGAEAILTTALAGADVITFYAAGGIKIVGATAPR